MTDERDANQSGQPLDETLLIQHKRYEEALMAFEQSLQRDPTNAHLYREKGLLLSYRLHNNDKALIAFEQALQLSPQDAEAWREKSRILWQLKLHPEALEAAEQAIQYNPYDAQAYYYKGMNLAELYQHIAALQAFEQALQLDPTNPDIYYMQNNVLRDLDRFDEAHTAFEAGANATQQRRKQVAEQFLQRVAEGKLDDTIEFGIHLFRGGDPEKWVDEKYALTGSGHARLEREDWRQQLLPKISMLTLDRGMCAALFTIIGTNVLSLITHPHRQTWETGTLECSIYLTVDAMQTILTFEIHEQEINQAIPAIVEALPIFRAIEQQQRQ